jgi:hypothetical protein
MRFEDAEESSRLHGASRAIDVPGPAASKLCSLNEIGHQTRPEVAQRLPGIGPRVQPLRFSRAATRA